MNSAYEVADLIRLMGEVKGRKRLQKIVYLLQQMDFPFEGDYEYGYYGPFSRGLSDELDDLAHRGLINEDTETTIVGDRFIYTPTEHLCDLLERHPEFSELNEDKLHQALDVITKENTSTLEIASSLLFLYRLGVTGTRLIDEVRAWKPKLHAAIPRAQDLLTRLGFNIA